MSEIWFEFARVFFRTYTFRILENFWLLFRQLFPWLVAGIFIAALLRKAFLGLARGGFLRTERPLNIALGALAGMAAPLPFYLAVPLSAVLIAAGLPVPVVLAFLVACPLIDPGLLLLTYGAFGWQMALARAVAAFLFGFTGGMAYRRLQKRLPLTWRSSQVELSNRQTARLAGRSFWTAVRLQSLFIAKIFSVSLLISAALEALVPPEYVRSLFGRSSSMSVLIAIGAGIPFYQCGGASIPIMQALTELGLSKGAVLAFFTSGPVTKISSMYAFREGYGTRFFLVFLGFTLAVSFAAGMLFNLIG